MYVHVLSGRSCSYNLQICSNGLIGGFVCDMYLDFGWLQDEVLMFVASLLAMMEPKIGKLRASKKNRKYLFCFATLDNILIFQGWFLGQRRSLAR
jgi:hypothetical protein